MAALKYSLCGLIDLLRGISKPRVHRFVPLCTSLSIRAHWLLHRRTKGRQPLHDRKSPQRVLHVIVATGWKRPNYIGALPVDFECFAMK